MAKWEYRLRISVPDRTEFIDAAWHGAFGSEATAVSAAVADGQGAIGRAFRSTEFATDDGAHYIIPTDKIQWIRVETRMADEGPR